MGLYPRCVLGYLSLLVLYSNITPNGRAVLFALLAKSSGPSAFFGHDIAAC